ncbi:MAG: HAMP domain-containing histidine kinase [Geodermatophilaceae bacterium]|nr:HAMP domain-containing histidine kinase [Geodermatophilaceae bacterium]
MTAPRSLRWRLVLGLLLVATLGVLAVSAAAVFALRSYLLQRVDDQLLDAAPGIARQLLLADTAFPPDRAVSRPLAPTDFVVQYVDDAGVVSSVVVATVGLTAADAPVITGLDAAEVGARDGSPFTARSADGEDYRTVALTLDPLPGTLVVSVPVAEIGSTIGRLLVVEGIATVIVLGLTVALGLVAVRVGLRPLTDVGGTARAIADGDLARRVTPAEPRTEIGRLGLALNDMLGQIEVAFADRQSSEERLRRFVADASHELRTPLTSIRGYAELHRQGAVTEPADVARVMGRIEGEATRMGRLVDDLLLLTRLDQLPAAARELVDLVPLVTGAVADLRAVQPTRPVELELTAGPVLVLGDPDQLAQVTANLVGNARVHTPHTTSVTVTLTRADGYLELQVADAGPGMAPEVAAHVFERFYRADGARSRARGGSGLGLSIVAAVVAAHGGTVAVESTPGAVFTVRLPLAGSAADSPQDLQRT